MQIGGNTNPDPDKLIEDIEDDNFDKAWEDLEYEEFEEGIPDNIEQD